MEKNKKAVLFKYLFLTSTVSGALGAYALYKQQTIIGWTLAGIWAVLAIFVRILIILDKKGGKNGTV
jgi:hypothetical protein